jgi:hypothetical protein
LTEVLPDIKAMGTADASRLPQKTVTFDPYSSEDVHVFHACMEGDGNVLKPVQKFSSATPRESFGGLPKIYQEGSRKEAGDLSFISEKRQALWVRLFIPVVR